MNSSGRDLRVLSAWQEGDAGSFQEIFDDYLREVYGVEDRMLTHLLISRLFGMNLRLVRENVFEGCKWWFEDV